MLSLHLRTLLRASGGRKGQEQMTTTNPRDANLGRAIPLAWPGAGQETYEQLLAFADKVGAAGAEASQRINAACAGAYEKLAHNPGGWQDGLTKAQQTLLGAVTDPSFVTTRGEDVQERVLALSDDLSEMGIDVALAYLRALEEATLRLCAAVGGADPRCGKVARPTRSSEPGRSGQSPHDDRCRAASQGGTSRREHRPRSGWFGCAGDVGF